MQEELLTVGQLRAAQSRPLVGLSLTFQKPQGSRDSNHQDAMRLLGGVPATLEKGTYSRSEEKLYAAGWYRIHRYPRGPARH